MTPDKSRTSSLLAGRSTTPLDERMTTRVVATLRGLQIDVPVEDQCDYRHEAASSSHFENDVDDDGNPYGVVIFGPDIYPGTSLLDPNSELSMKAAVAHELSHFHRWRDATELTVGHLDEALTSLDAALRYNNRLSAHEIQQLCRDAMKRISLYEQAQQLEESSHEPETLES